MTKPPVRIHAGNNGVYDAVQVAHAWRIRYISYVDLTALDPQQEFSTTSYESAHEAMLAYERGPISYRTNEVVA